MSATETIQTIPQAAAIIGPILRALWMIGVPAAIAFGAWRMDRKLVPAALFGGAVAALMPPAMFELGLPIILNNNPGGGAHTGLLYLQALRILVTVALCLFAALILRARAVHSNVPMPLGPSIVLFALFYITPLIPRATPLTRTFAPGVAGPNDPLRVLTWIEPVAPILLVASFVGIIMLARHQPRDGADPDRP